MPTQRLCAMHKSRMRPMRLLRNVPNKFNMGNFCKVERKVARARGSGLADGSSRHLHYNICHDINIVGDGSGNIRHLWRKISSRRRQNKLEVDRFFIGGAASLLPKVAIQANKKGKSLASETATACAGERLNNLATQTRTPTAFKANEQRGTYPDDDTSDSWRNQASSGRGERTGQQEVGGRRWEEERKRC
ncbi:hypothetical protein B0H14DRAFT_2623677 [Mycena olivaceomarginata]|nr:hypothetical protein B0H14DRAFT_2623677 [Mycena olivaceomarginata]